jgi:uncharacterized NAD-dependent epimerase/dehydratase family protein
MLRAERLAVLAEGELGVLTSKTAACMIRYQPERVACIIDSTKRGLDVEQVLGFGRGIPIIGSLEEALAFSPDSLLIGIAPRGGQLPAQWRQVVLRAIGRGLNVISGLHTMLEEDAEITRAAADSGVGVWDIRKPVVPDGVARGVLKQRKGKVLLTVGSDSRSGKMTVAYELTRYLKDKGIRAEFVATGQTGILLSGWGTAIDRVPGDFMSRVVEDLTVRALEMADVAVVEGQGSLIHPGYSGVSLAILHGCCPDAMILCHQTSRREIRGYGIAIPGIDQVISLYEDSAAPVFPSKVTFVALNTFDLDEIEARQATATIERQTGLPATDVVRYGCEKLHRHLGGML